MTSRVSPMGSNPMLQHRTSFMEPRGSLYDGEQKLRKRMKSRRTQEHETQLDLQSARFMEHGISLGMHRAKKEREMKSQEERQERDLLRDFVRKCFTCKECCYFSPKSPSSPDDKTKPQCHCGDFEENHYQPTQQKINFSTPVPVELNRKQNWNEVEHIMELRPTNAFGQIDFENEGLENRKFTEYIRISNTNKIEDVLELMLEFWGLLEPPKPSLCISVIGGAKNFKLEGRRKEVFHHGLIKAAQTTNAWLITSGLNLGIIRVVGDALQEGQTFHWGKKRLQQRLRCIGVAPWGYVLNNSALVSKDCQGSFPARYKVTNVIKSGCPVSLNPNHTHYIFVDEGYRRRYGGCKSAEVRSALERRISQPIAEGGLQIPVVLVIVEGGYDVFNDAMNSIRQRVPVVICDGTGRAADILAFAARKSKYGTHNPEKNIRELHEDHKQELIRRLTDKFGDTFKKEREKRLGSAIDCVEEIVSDEKLITVFDMNRSSDLDLSILFALLKVQGSSLHQLTLALTWNRVDIAAEKIFKDDFAWSDHPAEVLNNLVEGALLEDKVEFVKLFLQNGLVMKEFLTVSRLRALYNAEPAECHFRKVMHAMVPGVNLNSTIYLSQVRLLLRRLVMKYHNEIYDEDSSEQSHEVIEKRGEISVKQFQHPFNELFLWAVLTKKQTMARYLWERTNEAIPQAIAASRIYYALAKSLPSHASEEKHTYHEWKNDFEQLAVKVVEECNNIDPEKAALLIEKKHQTWGGLNCLEMAAGAQDRKFLSTVVCQNSVNFIWNQGVHCSIPIIFLCVFFPPLVFVPKLVRFQVPSVDGNSNCMFECKKLLTFYHAPKTKFVLNAIATFVTICFYAAFLLFGFKKEIALMEYIAIAIIFAFFVEECRELVASKSDTILEKIMDWWNFSSWNRMDVIMVLLGVVTACLRLATGSKYYYTCKTLYVLTGAFVFLRVFRLYSVNPRLGPKLVMIKKMVVELLLYVCILAVSLLTYGICSQSLLYPIRPFSWQAIKMIFYYPYWQIYGEIYLEAANAEEPGCNGTYPYNLKTGELCPTFHWLVPALLAVYLIIANVLLLNLLIAIFSNIFQEVQENSLEIWKFEMYFLVVEYERKPYLPFPLVVIEDIVRLIKFFICLCQCRKKDDTSDRDTSKDEFDEEEVMSDVIRFSHDAVQTFSSHLELELSQKVPVRLDQIDRRIEEVYRLIEDEKHSQAHLHSHRQSSLDQTMGPPRPGTAETRPHTAEAKGEPAKPELKHWPEAGPLLETTPRKKLENDDHPRLEAIAEAQVGIVRDQMEREEQARRFEEEMADPPGQPDDGSSCHSDHQNDLSGDLCRRLDEFENRTEAVLDNLRAAMFEQKKEKSGGASKKRVHNLESRLANLEENTGRSLANIESLLRRILTGKEEEKEEEREKEEEEREKRKKAGRRSFL